MLLHNRHADAQAQASSLANSLRSKERIEYAFRLANSRTVVAERYFHVVILAGGRYLDTRSLGLIAHRVVSIVQNVQEHLLQLVGIADDKGQVITKVFGYRNAAALQVIRT